jgi:hypothetical protein
MRPVIQWLLVALVLVLSLGAGFYTGQTKAKLLSAQRSWTVCDSALGEISAQRAVCLNQLLERTRALEECQP